ncbi:MAG: hypothetical protein HOL62_02515 [Candidatus Marinimicrobia bacterium]|nr:hypothetical protein [Candidatus Neomarinimicrobiota bacterium]MBT5251560.1 hypothetical protein [Candidatus Neomarinimicrobiota bacterium]MBT6839898.1 hypothetical protein [Candidatus Neomarinimicrobiota bacterium]MBT7172614.1 hypothetical protein [Candidatus Neomarinimicrobiota bacterium]MBT7433687.1 hypothetical protein [Candidatus Neomarinimicrobiota bacterium]
MLQPIIKNEKFNPKNLSIFILFYYKKFIRIGLIFLFVGLAYFFIKPSVYSSRVSFYTNYNEAPQSSFLSMLPAGMLGGGMGYTSLSFSIENYLSSEDFLLEIVNSDYDIDGAKTTLTNQWGSDYDNFIVLNPMTFAKRVNSYFNFTNGLSDQEKKETYAARILKNSLLFSEDRRSLLNTISISIEEDSELGIQIVSNVYDSIIAYSSNVVNTKAAEKKDFISNRLVAIQKSLTMSEDAMLKFSQENKQIENSPSLILERQRLQKDITLYNQLYFTLSDQLELAKINEKDNTTSFFLLDKPVTNRLKPGGGIVYTLIYYFTISIILSMIFYFYRHRKILFQL